jgi:Reverse transcriptase (RNA-dependent DNA polymerase)/Domain of unknown function (DUF6451)
MRWPNTGEKRTSTGEFVLYSGRATNENRASGVGFILSKEARRSLVEWQPISDRIIIARFVSKLRHVACVQVYAPTENATEDEKNEFYNLLNDSLDKIRGSDIVILMGDINAKVGNNRDGFENIMGNHGIGNRNNNGERFAELCMDRNLMIGGTMFPHKNIHKVTWVSPDGVTQNQIDHIAISREWRTSLLDVCNRRGADVYSDHHLVVGMVRIKLSTQRRRRSQTKRKPDLSALKDPAIRLHYASTVQQSLSAVTHNGLEHKWENTVKAFTDAAATTLGFPTRIRKEWISDDTWRLINERQQLKSDLTSATGTRREELQVSYREKDKAVGRSARNDKRSWLAEIANDAERASERRDYGSVYRFTRQLASKHHRPDYPVRASDGTLISLEEQQIARWTEHFQTVLNCASPGIPRSPPIPQSEPRDISVSPPTLGEVRTAILSLKNGKAAGCDGIYAELLKADSDLSTQTLHGLLSEIWNTEYIPTAMKEGMIVKIPKKGDLTNCANWRGITLQNTVNKVLCSIISKRIQDSLDSVLRPEQAGFRPNRSCTDQTNTLRLIIEQSVEYRSSLCIVFVDFERAFDSVGRNMMWRILASYGIPDKVVNIIKELYRDSSSRVLHKGSFGSPFSIYSGVKQGCNLSPLLFIIVVDWILKKVNRTTRGITWNLFHQLGDLDYADDIALLTHTTADMQAKLDKLVSYASQVGLRINVGKTKLLRIMNNAACRLSVGEDYIDEVDEFTYLGSVMSKDGGADADVNARIRKAGQTFGMLFNIWRSPQLSQNLKIKIFKSNVLSVLLYGCETWKVTRRITARLQVFVNKCLRRILRIRWQERITNEELWMRASFPSVNVTIKKRKWGWIGHTLRKPVDDTTRIALDWNPQGSRRVGRPSMTWRRTIEEEIRVVNRTWGSLKELAQRRVRWRGFVEDLCSLEE